MKTYRDLSMPSLNQFGAVGIGATPSRRHFRKGRRSPSGGLRTVGIIAVAVVLAHFNGFPEAEAAFACEVTLASYLANPQQCDTEVQGTVEEVTRSYQNRGYVRLQDTRLWRSEILPVYGDLLAGTPCELLADHDLDEDSDYTNITIAVVCPSTIENLAGVTISPTQLRIVEGESASYGVSLTSEPEGTVSVSIGVLPPALAAVFPPPPTFDVTVSTTSLSFSPGNWSVPQTVTVRVAEDDHVSGDLEYAIVHSVSGYGDVTTADRVTVNAVDNDSRGVTVTPTALTVDEGESGAYTVVLDASPGPGQDGLTVTPTSNNADVTFAPATLAFTSTNWNAPQTVTVSAAHDDDAADESATLTHAVSGYGDVTAADDVTVNVVDDDSRGVTATPTALTVDEGESGAYTVVLDANPDPGQDGLTVTVTPRSNNADVTFAPATLAFTSTNWNAPQTVTVSAAHDDDAADESATLTHAVSGYGDVTAADDVTVNVVDDDSRGVTATPTALTVDEGESGAYTVVLDANPDPGQDGLTVTVTPRSNNADVTFAPATLAFTSANWNAPQTVTVSAAHDDDAADERATLTHAVSGYGNVTAAGDVTVNVDDDDSREVTITPTALTVDEGESGAYTVVLDANPDPGLTVTVTPRSNNADVTFAPATLAFTSANWNVSQTVTVSAAHDGDAADESAALTHAVSGYGNVTAADDVTVNVDDDDQAANAPGGPRNLRATPGDGEVTLTWSPPLSDGGSPIIRYEHQVDGGAWSETGEPTRHVVDGLTNGTQYTFGVRAINSVNEQDPGLESTSALAAATPRAEVEHVDPVEQEAVTETVEAVTAAAAANIAANIGTRFAAARSGSTVVVGGQPVNFGSGSSSAFISAAAERDRDPFDEFSSASHGRSLGVDELLRSSAFEISLNAADDEAQGAAMAPQWTIWGRGDLQFFESLPERGSTYDGGLKAGYLGIDGRSSDQWLFGLAASFTNTEADYGLGDGSGGEGRLDVSITGLHPYLRYSPDDTNEFWAILGLGQGEITNERAGSAEREASDIDMRMVAAGARRNLVSDKGWNLALLGDVGIAQIETEDGVQAIQGLSVDTWRGRLGVEGSHTALLDSGSSVTTFAEVAGRYDGGGDEDEVGLEISPGVYVAGPNGLGFEVRGRMLALHTAENYEEYGASMTLSVSPRPDGSGLSLSLAPRVGGETGGADTLWREDPFALSGARSAKRDAPSLDVGVGYGIRAMNGLLTPFGEFNLSNEDRRRLRAGTRFNLRRSSLGELSLELAGERHESDGFDPEHRVGVIGRLRF